MDRDTPKDVLTELAEKTGVNPAVLKATMAAESAEGYREKIASAEKGDNKCENTKLAEALIDQYSNRQGGMGNRYQEAIVDPADLASLPNVGGQLAACANLLSKGKVTKIEVRRNGYPAFIAWVLGSSEEPRGGDIRLKGGQVARVLRYSSYRFVNGKLQPI